MNRHFFAYLVASAYPNRLWLAVISQVPRAAYAQILRWLLESSKSEQGLECGRRLLTAVVPEDELVQISLQLSPTHTVVGADQPLAG